MNNYSVYDVFTPSSPAKLAFVDRPALNENLVNAIRTPGKQIVVYGHSGSGKTTLLGNKLKQLYELHVTSRCLLTSSIDQLILEAFDQLNPYYLKTKSSKDSSGVKATLGQEYFGIKSAIEASQSSSETATHERILPPQLSPAALARFMGAAKACWVLEDFHKVPDAEKSRLSQIMKVFMDTAADYPDVKIIAIGAVDTARQVVQYDQEMRNRIAEFQVPLMTNEESREILSKAEGLLNIAIADEIKEKIAHYANGLPSVCHHLGLNLCLVKDIQIKAEHLVAFDMSDFQKAFDQYVSEMSDTLKSAFDKAFRRKKKGKFDNCRLIVQALATFEQEGATSRELSHKIRQTEPRYPAGNLTLYVTQLTRETRGQLLRYDNDSGRYSFADPIYRAFALALLKQPARSAAELDIQWTISPDILKAYRDEMFAIVFSSITESKLLIPMNKPSEPSTIKKK